VYLDARGRPLPLALSGRGATLRSLVKHVLPQANADDVIRALIELKGIRRRGERYVPTRQYLTYNAQRLSALAHALTALQGMLRTVEHNLSSGRAATRFERAAINPGFPVVELPAFHRRLKESAGDFIWAVDGEMRRREQNARGGARTRLGVGIFAFEEPVGARRSGAPRASRKVKRG